MIVYPHHPGFKSRGTSRIAAKSMAPLAPTLRDRVLALYAQAPNGLTADEVADKLGLTPFSIRPRVSELARLGALTDTMERRANATSGRIAIVWRIK